MLMLESLLVLIQCSVIYNTTGQDVELWKGSSWLSLGAGNMRTWSGEEGRPTSPSTGQFGFNTQQGKQRFLTVLIG